jgi:hypothetical protein
MSDSFQFWFALITMALLLSVGGCVEAASCKAKYQAYGQTSWGPVKGCMVQRGDKSIPAETIREVQP